MTPENLVIDYRCRHTEYPKLDGALGVLTKSIFDMRSTYQGIGVRNFQLFSQARPSRGIADIFSIAPNVIENSFDRSRVAV